MDKCIAVHGCLCPVELYLSYVKELIEVKEQVSLIGAITTVTVKGKAMKLEGHGSKARWCRVEVYCQISCYTSARAMQLSILEYY